MERAQEGPPHDPVSYVPRAFLGADGTALAGGKRPLDKTLAVRDPLREGGGTLSTARRVGVGQNTRKTRKSYRFSKDGDLHNAATSFLCYRDNFCWPVRTLRVQRDEGAWRQRTPAMAAGLARHVWTLQEWRTYPAKPG